MKIAIIGAGISGLASARRAQQYNLDFVIFEKTSNIGGLWVYNGNATDELDIVCQSAVHPNLRTITASHLMEVRDFKFTSESSSCFPRHDEVLQYIHNLAEKSDLEKYIKYNREVNNISWSDDKWHIEVKNLQNDSVEKYTFDGVVICVGANSKPYVPDIPGLETFNGHLTHSHSYRKNTAFEGKSVLVVGSGPSGRDISIGCTKVARKVILSVGDVQRPEDLARRNGITLKPRLVSIENNNVHFKDGSSATVDAIVLCTGYLFHLPFLDPSCGIEVHDGMMVRPLYKYFINIKHPTMALIGLLYKGAIFRTIDFQAEVFIKYLTGKINLPNTTGMLEWLRDDEKRRSEAGIPIRKYHWLGEEGLVKPYSDDLCQMGEIEPPAPVLFKIQNKIREIRQYEYNSYTDAVFEIIDSENYKHYMNKAGGK